jgi:hypothetical protein
MWYGILLPVNVLFPLTLKLTCSNRAYNLRSTCFISHEYVCILAYVSFNQFSMMAQTYFERNVVCIHVCISAGLCLYMSCVYIFSSKSQYNGNDSEMTRLNCKCARKWISVLFHIALQAVMPESIMNSIRVVIPRLCSKETEEFIHSIGFS